MNTLTGKSSIHCKICAGFMKILFQKIREGKGEGKRASYLSPWKTPGRRRGRAGGEAAAGDWWGRAAGDRRGRGGGGRSMPRPPGQENTREASGEEREGETKHEASLGHGRAGVWSSWSAGFLGANKSSIFMEYTLFNTIQSHPVLQSNTTHPWMVPSHPWKSNQPNTSLVVMVFTLQ